MVLPFLPVFALRVPSSAKHRRILGENIRVIRKKAGFSQEKLAEKAELNSAYVSDVERGEENISVDALVRIAQALKVELADLVRGIR
jgi:transcriptional regulator with XRE-family HTH domain